jgi:hypothetical protein
MLALIDDYLARPRANFKDGGIMTTLLSLISTLVGVVAILLDRGRFENHCAVAGVLWDREQAESYVVDNLRLENV